MDAIFGAVVLCFIIALYFAPSIVSANRNHHNHTAITVFNILLGWTFLGWVIALVWSLTAVQKI